MSLTTNKVISGPAADESRTSRTHHVEPRASQAHDITAAVLAVYRDLDSLPDLRPCPEVDDLFGRLVRFVLAAPDDVAPAVLGDPAIQAIRPRLLELCARGESELELAWANRIGTSPAPREELTRFPYFGNYRQLSRMEIGVLASALNRPVRSLAFVGTGPLPLSALLLAGELDVAVDNLDRDPDAIAAASRVARVLGYPDFRFHHLDIADADLCVYDVVVLAALVGDSPADKRRVLGHLARSMAPGAILLARSARGLRTLLYPAIDLETLGGFELLTVMHPLNDVINSAVLARALGSGE